MREVGALICKTKAGKLVLGSIGVGTQRLVRVPLHCPVGKPYILFHTHPSGSPVPSKLDIQALHRYDIPYLCIYARGRTVCYGRQKSEQNR